MDAKLITTVEAAAILGLSTDQVQYLADNGTLWHCRVGPPPGRRLFLNEDVKRVRRERAERTPATGAERMRQWRDRQRAKGGA